MQNKKFFLYFGYYIIWGGVFYVYWKYLFSNSYLDLFILFILGFLLDTRGLSKMICSKQIIHDDVLKYG